METKPLMYFQHDAGLIGNHDWNRKPRNGPSLKREISSCGVLFVKDTGVDFLHTASRAKEIVEDLLENPRVSIISGFNPTYLTKSGFRSQSDDRMFADINGIFKGDDDGQIWASVIEMDNR